MGLGKWLKESVTGWRSKSAVLEARDEGSEKTRDIVQAMFPRRRSSIPAQPIQRRETVHSD